MLWLAMQYLSYLVAALLLGALVGWLWWGRGIRRVRRDASAQLSALRREAERADDAAKRSSGSLHELRVQVAVLQADSASHLVDIDSLRERHQAAQTDLERARLAVAGQASQLEAATARVRQLEPSLADHQQQRDLLAGKLETVTARADAAARDLVQLRTDLAVVRTDMTRLEAERAQLGSSLRAADERAQHQILRRMQMERLRDQANRHLAEAQDQLLQAQEELRHAQDSGPAAVQAQADLELLRRAAEASGDRAAHAERALLDTRRQVEQAEAERDLALAVVDELRTESASRAVASRSAPVAATSGPVVQFVARVSDVEAGADSDSGPDVEVEVEIEVEAEAGVGAGAPSGDDVRALVGVLRGQWVTSSRAHRAAEQQVKASNAELHRLGQELAQLRQQAGRAHADTHALLVQQRERVASLQQDLSNLAAAHAVLQAAHGEASAQLHLAQAELIRQGEGHGQEMVEANATISQLRNDVDELWNELSLADDERRRLAADLEQAAVSAVAAGDGHLSATQTLMAQADDATRTAMQWQRELEVLRVRHQEQAAASAAAQQRWQLQLDELEAAHREALDAAELARLQADQQHQHQLDRERRTHQAALLGAAANAHARYRAALATSTATFQASLQAAAAAAESLASQRTQALTQQLEHDAQQHSEALVTEYQQRMEALGQQHRDELNGLLQRHQHTVAELLATHDATLRQSITEATHAAQGEAALRLAAQAAQAAQRADDLMRDHADALAQLEVRHRVELDEVEERFAAQQRGAEELNRDRLEARASEVQAATKAQVTAKVTSVWERRLDVALADEVRERDAIARLHTNQLSERSEAVRVAVVLHDEAKTEQLATDRQLSLASQRAAALTRELLELRRRHEEQLALTAAMAAKVALAGAGLAEAPSRPPRRAVSAVGTADITLDITDAAVHPNLDPDLNLNPDALADLGQPGGSVQAATPVITLPDEGHRELHPAGPASSLSAPRRSSVLIRPPATSAASRTVAAGVRTDPASSAGTAMGMARGTSVSAANGLPPDHFQGHAAVVSGMDDLQRIEGIGPKIHAALRVAGITSFVRLSAASDDQLRDALVSAGLVFAPSLGTWAEQATFLVTGDEDGFQRCVALLVAARSPEADTTVG